MNLLNSKDSRFPDLYLPKTRKRLNALCFWFTAVVLGLSCLISYILISGPQEKARVILLTLMGYSGLSLLRMCLYVYGSLNYSDEEKQLKPLEESDFYPFISILVPAYNEEAVIDEVIRNYSVIDYPNFEIIIVDDGSKDLTFEVAKAAVKESDLDIQVYKKVNGGKASALNFALAKAKGEFVLCMDADSKLSPLTLKSGVRHFETNPNLASVAGQVKVENTDTMLGRMQYLDYLFGHFQKKLLSTYKSVTIVPGPIGLFRKSFITEIGGYERENTTYAEDTELTLKLLIAGKDIISEDGMIAYTEAPNNYADLYRQRYRWTRGIFQAIAKNGQGFLESSHSRNHFLFIYLIWEQVLFPIIDFALLMTFILCYFFSEVDSLASALLLYVYFIELVMAIFATKGEKGRIKLILQSVWSRIFYSNILLVWKLTALYDEWTARGMSWDKLERAGFTKKLGEV